jgi:hypothetical protein
MAYLARNDPLTTVPNRDTVWNVAEKRYKVVGHWLTEWDLDEAKIHTSAVVQTAAGLFGVRMTWAELSGRLEPISVTVTSDGAPVIADAIRRLPIGELQRECRKEFLGTAAEMFGHDSQYAEPVLALATLGGGGGHRGVAATEEELQVVADVYRKAWGMGDPVTEAVASHFGISRSTAAKRIMKARAAGLLDDIRRIR